MNRLHGNTKLYGYNNVGFYPTRPWGTESWYRTRQERDAALKAARTRAVVGGLAQLASLAALYPITTTASALRADRALYTVHVVVSDELMGVLA